jgi:hypothetical protein
MTLSLHRYDDALAPAWDAFVRASRNGTFLLERAYMDYHRDRFRDHSLVLRGKDDAIVALLPANEHEGALHSHGGLTYGGLVVGAGTGAVAALEMVEALRAYLAPAGLSALHYKTIPSIYHRQPAEEDRYALFRAGATLTRRDTLSVVPREDRLRFQERRQRGVKSAAKAGVRVEEAADLRPFWTILTDNLQERYGVNPVHSVEEIELLRSRFPERIRLFVAKLGDDTLGGCCVFETDRVAHVQYISASAAGRDHHALDAVFAHLINQQYVDKPFFDFGISNEQAGRVLNVGLVEQKEGFGARTVVHDFYELSA